MIEFMHKYEYPMIIQNESDVENTNITSNRQARCIGPNTNHKLENIYTANQWIMEVIIICYQGSNQFITTEFSYYMRGKLLEKYVAKR